MNVSISRDGAELGEWTEAEVRAFYNEGRLISTDQYWIDGMTEWSSISNFIKSPPPFPDPLFSKTIHSKQSIISRDDLSNFPQVKRSRWNTLDLLFGRTAYIASLYISAIIAAILEDLSGLNIFMLGWCLFCIVLVAIRYRNIGFSGWNSLLSLIPLYWIVLNVRCCCLPPQYAESKKLDKGAWAGGFMAILPVICITVLLMLGKTVQSVRATANSPDFKEQLQQYCSEIGKDLPKNVGNNTQLDDATSSNNNTIVLHYTVKFGDSFSRYEVEANAKDLGEKMVASRQTTKNFLTVYDITVDYKYVSDTGNPMFDVFVNNENYKCP